MLGTGKHVTLGRLKGIPVRLDATFAVVPLALFAGLQSHLHEALWPAVAAGTAGVFLSILLHEVGHAATARWQQVGVTEIVVGGFFGFAALRRQAIPRKTQLRILAAGPAANLVVILVLWSALAATSPDGIDFRQLFHPVGQAMGWQEETVRVLALVNLGMFVFNMIPAFPLDGGKLLILLLDQKLPAGRGLQLVTILSIVSGAVMALLGLVVSLFLTLLGALIVLRNVRRLRRIYRERRAGTSA